MRGTYAGLGGAVTAVRDNAEPCPGAIGGEVADRLRFGLDQSTSRFVSGIGIAVSIERVADYHYVVRVEGASADEMGDQRSGKWFRHVASMPQR